MSESDDSQNTRPISVAELLARNGTIGSPPVGGRRRRRRGNSDAISVAELTGEIPVIRDEPPVQEVEVEETASVETVIIYSDPEPDQDADVDEVDEAEVDEAEVDEAEVAEAAVDEVDVEETAEEPEPEPEPAPEPEPEPEPEPDPDSPGAEEMAPDPVDESEAELRPYLDSSTTTLFSGETIADDIARGGPPAQTETYTPPAPVGRFGAVRNTVVAVLQSLVAVAFGAGLFLAFDQLWRWNNLVALVLSVLVILGLVIAVRIVRKTEDITSTLIAVAVGALVTLGPLALLQST